VNAAAALPDPDYEPEPEARPPLEPVSSTRAEPRAAPQCDPCGAAGCSLRFAVTAAASALPAARDQARVFLREFALPERAVFDVVLCLEEACKNAIRFSGSERDIDVTLGVSASAVHLVIRDHGHGFEPAPVDVSHKPDPFAQHGRGLFLLHSLMDDVRIERDRGAVVIARLRLAG
jgi:anti-sigma regulatory factor (Ser/Thr protein kinase)